MAPNLEAMASNLSDFPFIGPWRKFGGPKFDARCAAWSPHCKCPRRLDSDSTNAHPHAKRPTLPGTSGDLAKEQKTTDWVTQLKLRL